MDEWFCIPCGFPNLPRDTHCYMCGRNKEDATDIERWKRFLEEAKASNGTSHVSRSRCNLSRLVKR